MSPKTLSIASLFAGCGGMDLGATGGFRFNGHLYRSHPTTIVHASDFDERIVEIYNRNFAHSSVVGDVRLLDSKNLPKYDILLGGFPCQSFSVIAQNPVRLGIRDEKGQLFFEMKRILEETKPRAFIAENVKGLLSVNHGQTFPLVLEEFSLAGYHVTYRVLNASHYGVPQKRERVFIVGFRSAADLKRFDFPTPTSVDNPASLGRFLEDPETVEERYFFSERAVSGMRSTKNGALMNKGRIQSPDRPSNTLGAHLAKVSLNSTDPVLFVDGRYRMFTPREVARIQSFPERFKLGDTNRANYIALGNAVPPVLMWHVTDSLLQALNSSRPRALSAA
jgi:DNA (cytosine-5)-methyltransferase 1